MSAPATTAKKGMFTLVIGSIAFLIGLVALIQTGSLPLFTIGTCLFLAGFIGRVMNNDVIDVFILGIVVIAILVYGLHLVDEKFLSHGGAHHTEANAAASAEQH